MTNEIFNMNGYGLYVWSAFIFSLFSFATLYAVTKAQYIKEREKFLVKFGELDSKKAEVAKLQKINKEILYSNQRI